MTRMMRGSGSASASGRSPRTRSGRRSPTRWTGRCGRGGVRAAGDEGGGAMASRPGHRSRPGEVNGERPLFLLLLRGESGGAAASGEERAASRRLTASGRRRGVGAASRRRGSGVGRGEERGRDSRARARRGSRAGEEKYGWGHNTNGAPPPGAP